MPLYEYRCLKCGHECELLVNSSETPHCPSCNATRLEKQFSVFAVSSSGSNAAKAQQPAACRGCESWKSGGCGMGRS